jgi:hypothetical protein
VVDEVERVAQRLGQRQLATPPGHAELDFRLGDYSFFRTIMLAALERVEVDPKEPPGAPPRPLAGTTRDPESNWMIALIDGWALVGEILTFYQQRFANEGYLGTAQEEVSIELLRRTLGRTRSGSTELARSTSNRAGAGVGGDGAWSGDAGAGTGAGSQGSADAGAIPGTGPASPTQPPATIEPISRIPNTPTALGPAGPVFPTPGASTATPLPSPQKRSDSFGYRVDPGAAATTDVSFRVVPHQAANGRALIRAGTAIRSHRTDGRAPVVFETGTDLVARLSYNQIAAAQHETVVAPTIDESSTGLQLAGTSTALKPGSQILIVGKLRTSGALAWLFGSLVTVEPSRALGLTLVTWTLPGTEGGGLINQASLNGDALEQLEVFGFARRLAAFGHDARPFGSAPISEKIRSSYSGGVSLRATFKAAKPDATSSDSAECEATSWRRLLDGFPSRSLAALAVGNDGSLWVGGEFGVACLPPGGAGPWTVSNKGLGSADITTLCVDSAGSLWAGSSQGRVYRCPGAGHDWTAIAGGYQLVESNASVGGTSVSQQIPVRADLPRSPILAIQPHIVEVPGDPSTVTSSTSLSAVLVANGLGIWGNQFDGVGWYSDNDAMLSSSSDTENTTPPLAKAALVDLVVLGPTMTIEGESDSSRLGYAIAASSDVLYVFAWHPFDKIVAPSTEPTPSTKGNPTAPSSLPGWGPHEVEGGVLQLLLVEIATDVELLVLTSAGPKRWDPSSQSFLGCDGGLDQAVPTRGAAVASELQSQELLDGYVAVATDGATVWAMDASYGWTALDGFSGVSGTPTRQPDVAVGIAVGGAGELLASAPLTLRSEWPGFHTIMRPHHIDVDAKPFALAPESWVVSSEPGLTRAFSLVESEKTYRSEHAYGKPGQVFRLHLRDPFGDDGPTQVSADRTEGEAERGDPRKSVIFAAGKGLDVYEFTRSDTRPVGGRHVEFAGIIEGFEEFSTRDERHLHELRSLAFTGRRVRVCVTQNGGLWSRSADGSSPWTQRAMASRGVTALCAGASELWVGTERSGIRVRRADGTWEDRSAGIDGSPLPEIVALAVVESGAEETEAYAIVGDELMRWTESASRWSAVERLAKRGVLSLLVYDGAVFVGTKGEGLWRSDGAAFVLMDSVEGLELRALAYVPSVCAGAGEILMATNAGIHAIGSDVAKTAGGTTRVGAGGPDACQAVAGDGRTIVAGTSGEGLWYLDTHEDSPRWRPSGLAFRGINVVRYEHECWSVGTVGAGVYVSGDARSWDWWPIGSADDVRALAREPDSSALLAGAASSVCLVTSSGAAGGELVYTRALTIPGSDASQIERELQQGFISDTLRAEFEREKVDLAKDAVVETLVDDERWLLHSRADPEAAIYLAIDDPIDGLCMIEPNTLPILLGSPKPVDGLPGFERVSLGDGDLEGELLLARHQSRYRPPHADDEPVSEVKRLLHARFDYRSATTVVTLDFSLDHVYERSDLEVSANVVRASQGETINGEILGSGDGGKANQRFVLHRAPLTFLPAPPPVYRQSTLTIQVDDVTWTEVETLHDVGPDSQVYSVDLDHEGRATINFGDGEHGARLPTGTQNVIATYRVGLGSSGDVAGGSLNVLLSPPPGVASVTNPIPASDGVDPESAGSVRRKIPLSSQTMDRVVTLADFASVVTCYPGVRQAVATSLRVGSRRVIQVSVAFDARVSKTEYSQRCRALDRALADVQVAPARPTSTSATVLSYFEVCAELDLAEGYGGPDVSPVVFDALYQRWSPTSANIGESVSPNAVAAVIQAVVGVEGVHVWALTRTKSGFDGLEELDAAPAHVEDGKRGRELVAASTLVLDATATPRSIPVGVAFSVFARGSVTLIVRRTRA